MKNNLLLQALTGNGFMVVHYDIVNLLGLDAAVLLSYLVNCKISLKEENLLNGEWFYQTIPQIEKKTTLKRHKQTEALKVLKKLGYVKTKLHGMPSKKYYYIDEDAFLENIQKDIKKKDNKKQGRRRMTTSKRKGRQTTSTMVVGDSQPRNNYVITKKKKNNKEEEEQANACIARTKRKRTIPPKKKKPPINPKNELTTLKNNIIKEAIDIINYVHNKRYHVKINWGKGGYFKWRAMIKNFVDKQWFPFDDEKKKWRHFYKIMLFYKEKWEEQHTPVLSKESFIYVDKIPSMAEAYRRKNQDTKQNRATQGHYSKDFKLDIKDREVTDED